MATTQISRQGRGLMLPNGNEVLELNAEEEKGEEVVKETLELLEKGEKEIKLDEKHKDAIMILGNTGSGKTTFTQFVAGDNTKLISIPTDKDSNEYIIVGPGISNNTLKSETVYPELVIDPNRKAAYYDCPGFSDTQGPSHEIAETYFIKKVLDFLKSLKMIFVINHSSVRKGFDRQDFMQLLRHATDLVKNVEKFKPSIAMVATKVENQYVKKGKDFVLVGDDKVINSIAGFLQEAKEYLEDSLKLPNISEKEKRFYENAIKLVEILLEKEGDKYSRIGIFRIPDREGPVSDIPLLQKCKQYIEKIIYEKLHFSEKNNEDFGYTVSDKTKISINDIVKEINKNLWSKLTNISGKMQEYCKNIVEQVRDKIESFASAVNPVEANPSEAKELRDEFVSAYNSTSELVSKTTNLTNPQELAVLVNTTISNLKIDVPESDLSYIETQGKYFNFLQTVSDWILSSKPWNQVFKEVETFLSGSKTIILHDVDSVAKNISDRIQNELNDTMKVVQAEYNKNIKSLEIQKLPSKLERDYQIIFQLTKEIKNETTTEKLVNATRYAAENLNVSLPKQTLQNITNLGRYLKFLEIINNKPLNVRPVTWLYPFHDLVQYLYESEKWYTFLEDLYNKFSEYDVQKDRQRYNVADLEDWGQPGKPQGISITPKSFEMFLDKIRNFNVKEYETINKLTKITDLQIEDINLALSVTLKHRPRVRCSDSYVTVEGSYIVLAEILNNLKSNSDTDNSCNNFESKLGAGKYDLFKVSSLNRIFIDADLSFSGKSIPVAVIAPKWEVLGSRRIDLSGAEGTPPEEPKAKNGVRPGENGANGVPGNPGVSGETFFGIGASFAGGSNLEIISAGGKGGHAQNGGDGARGEGGRDATIPSKKDPECSGGKFRGFRCEEWAHESHPLERKTTYKIFGAPGGRGGNGGDGGKGGQGGHSGDIRVMELNGPSEITNHRSEGGEGGIGDAGAGGEGAKNGDDVIAVYLVMVLSPDCMFNCYIEEWNSKQTVKNGFSPNGSSGKKGANNVGQKDAVPAKGIKSVPNIVNEYKKYLRENLTNRFTKDSLLRFLEQLNKSNEVRNLYDIFGFIDEFEGLEEQFHELSEQVDFSIFYDSLLERIREFAKNLKKGTTSRENKKVLNYLYTATLARIYNLRESSETRLIIDIRKYMNLIHENIKTLKDLKTQNNKVEVIKKYKKSYKSGIDKKIEEANAFIKNIVSPELENINAKINDEIDNLIDEVITMQKETEKDIKKLEEKKRELQKSLEMKSLFSCFQMVGGFVQFLGPVGKIAGAVMDGTSAVGDAFTLDDQTIPVNLPDDIASSMEDIVGQLKSMRNKKITFLQKHLDDLAEEIKKNPEKLGDMEGKINEIKDKLQKASENKLDYKQVKTLENDLNEELERKGVDLKKNPKDKKSGIALKVIEKATKIFKYGSLLLSVYDKMKQENDKMDVVNDSVKELEGQLENLREYEDSIYDTMVPMLDEMMEHMKDVRDKLGTKSQVALDVTKWQVQSNLKDMRLEMQKLTEGFSVKDDLSRSIEKLDEVMTTLITIYDRIQSYQDQKNLADYIGDISSVAASEINIKNQQLVNAVNHLEYVIRANIVLEQYKSAIDALKQWVFPFADRYIEKSMLPFQLELETNIEDLVENAARQMEAIKQKIDLYDSSVKNGDEYLQCEEFSSRYVSSQPFTVWKNEEFVDLISDLLSGKRVTFKADVKYSSPYKDAIKFSEIDFHFKIKNETTQSLMYEILKGFDIRATHLGNSYYRSDDKIVLITSDSVTVSYSYEKNDDGTPIRSNAIYNTLKSGDLLLSPYTLWEASLIKRTNEYSFKDLEKFKNETDLELSGFGS